MGRTPARATQGDISDDTPLSLEEAASVLMRGMFTKWTLKAAADRKELVTFKLGRIIVTTPAYVREWVELCRAKGEGRTSISRNEMTGRRATTSETGAAVSQLDLARASLQALGQNSQDTSTRRRPLRLHQLTLTK